MTQESQPHTKSFLEKVSVSFISGYSLGVLSERFVFMFEQENNLRWAVLGGVGVCSFLGTLKIYD